MRPRNWAVLLCVTSALMAACGSDDDPSPGAAGAGGNSAGAGGKGNAGAGNRAGQADGGANDSAGSGHAGTEHGAGTAGNTDSAGNAGEGGGTGEGGAPSSKKFTVTLGSLSSTIAVCCLARAMMLGWYWFTIAIRAPSRAALVRVL